MNVIYIHTHDTGRYISPYGVNVATPHLQKFAEQGTLFRKAFCVGPTCSPSRSGLLTGMLPHDNGMIGLAHRGFGLNDYKKHLANHLKSVGYETVLCGIQHVAHDEQQIGYDKIITREKSKNEEYDLHNALEVCKYLKEDKEKPFFLSFGMWRTHRKFPEVGKEVVNPDYVQPPYPIFDNKENRQDMANFMASAKEMDKCVGKVLECLNETGLREKTIVIFTTDHGIAFPHMKCNLYDTGIGVSLILDYPKNPLKGQVTDALVSHLDIYPTLCDLLGISKPQRLQGHSVVPLLQGKTEAIRDHIISEVNYHAAYEPKRCLRTERYKLVRHFDTHSNIVPSNIDDSPSKSLLCDNGYLEYKIDKDMLFDLYIDPVERVNLTEDPRYKEIYELLATKLEEHMQKTKDPLLQGQLVRPEDAKVNKLSCISPQEEEWEGQ